MAATRILLDTGPLVAYFSERDQWHEWAVPRWQSFREPVETCESVLSECVFLLQSARVSVEPVLEAIESGAILVRFNLADQQPDICRLMRKYEDQEMSLADACLVRMAELSEHVQVFTTDEDFAVYRRHGRDLIPLLSPFSHTEHQE